MAKTDRETLKDQLIDNIDFYTSLFECHPDALYALDSEGNYLFANTASEKMSGYQGHEIEQMNFLQVVHPEDRQARLAHFQQALQGVPQQYETRVMRRDGSLFYADVTYLPMIIAGQVVGVFGFSKDITQDKLAEEKVRIGKNSLEMAQQVANIGNWDVDLTTGQVLWSDELYRIFGVDPLEQEPSYQLFLDFVDPEDRSFVHQAVQDARRGKPYNIEYRIVRSDGAIRCIHTRGRLLTNEEGKTYRMIGTLQDITEKKLAEEKLRKTEQLFHLMSENTQDIISFNSPDGICLYVSPSITASLGYLPEEVIGQQTNAFWHPEDREFLSQQTFADADVFSCRVRHKNGHYLWFETTYKTIRNEAGEVESVLGIGRNITERKLSEMELLHTQEQLDSLVEHNIDAISIYDKESRLLRVNRAFLNLYGWSEEELYGKPLSSLPFLPDDPKFKEEVQGFSDLVRAGKAVTGREITRISKTGQKLHLLISAFPIRDKEGRFNGWAATMRDISEQRQAEDRVLQSEKLAVVGQLAAGIAHEIRNPLTALKGFTQLMKLNTDSKHAHYLDIMEMEMNRIELILSELLVLAKPQIENVNHDVDLAQIIRDVTSLLQSQANLLNIEMVFEQKANLPLLTGVPNQLKQVFINFLKNAMEAMPSGGRIDIQLEKSDADVCIRFIDEGCGMPEEQLRRIGEPFYTTKAKGTGLGMMVSKKIIEQHRGKIKVQSVVEQGTTLEVLLPLPSA